MNTMPDLPNSETVPVAAGLLLTCIADRPNRVPTALQRPPAIARILKGILDWLDDKPTLEACIVEDVARMIELCKDREELRDLSVQIRELMFRYTPDRSRVALTEAEAQLLRAIQQ